MTTVIIACKLRTGVYINGELVRGYFRPPGEPVPPDSIDGYAMTEIPREAWELWIKHNSDAEIVKNRYIIMADDEAGIRAKLSALPRVQRTFASVPYTGR